MSAKGMTSTLIWTQLVQALKKDHPDLQLPEQAGAQTRKLIHEISDMLVTTNEGEPT